MMHIGLSVLLVVSPTLGGGEVKFGFRQLHHHSLTTREAAWYIFSVLSVCMYVCLSDNNFIFAHAVYLQGIRLKFVYEGHWVKVKVIGAKKAENSYSHSVKLRSAITPVL